MNYNNVDVDILIIGAGPIGLFTIFQAGMLGMKCAIIDSRNEVGGQCSALYPEKPIYDIPAYPITTGANLVDNLKKQADNFKPLYYLDQEITNLTKNGNIFEITTSKEINIKSKVVIIAAGAGAFVHRKPPLPHIELFENKSIFYSVTNRSDFTFKNIAIAGGGDSAIDWAISLSEVANKIYLIHRREIFKALDNSMNKIAELVKLGKIELVLNCQLESIEGENGYLKKILVRDFNNQIRYLDTDILLPFFGLIQNIGSIANWGLNLKSNHIIVSQPHYQTNIDGIYAVGDIATYDGKLKLILTGFAEAASSIHHAYSRVFDGKALHFQYSTSKGVKS
jgi:thioredoxin reductase (NADPH)